MYSCQGNNNSNNYNANNNIYFYVTSSGPSTSFTTFELLFLVSTVTFGKPLLSINKKQKKQGHFYSLICGIIAESTLVLSISKSSSLSYFSYSKLIGLTMAHTKNQIENVGREKLVEQVLKFSNFNN